MLNVAVSQLKARLSRFVEAAKHGQEIVITDRNKPVAILRPIERHLRDARLLNDLIQHGFGRPALRPLTDSLIDAGQPTDPTGSVLSELLAERSAQRQHERAQPIAMRTETGDRR